MVKIYKKRFPKENDQIVMILLPYSSLKYLVDACTVSKVIVISEKIRIVLDNILVDPPFLEY